MLEKNGRNVEYFLGEVSTDRITAIQVLYGYSSCIHLFSLKFGHSCFCHRKCTGSLLEYGICSIWSWRNWLHWSRRGLNISELWCPVMLFFHGFLSLTEVFCSEQLELLIATLIDLDAMDGKSSVSLLAECSSSPDVNTRCVVKSITFYILDSKPCGVLHESGSKLQP